MIRDTLFTCPVLRRVVYLVSGYTHGERFVHRQGVDVLDTPFSIHKVLPFWKHLWFDKG